MALEKQRRLIDLLLSRTRDGKVDWKPTPEPTAFQVSSPSSTIQLRMIERPNQREPDFLVSLINSEGEVADVFTDIELNRDQEDIPEEMRTNYYRELEDLYERARRAAKGADQILNAILKELGDDEIPF